MLKAVVFDMDGVIVDTEPISLKSYEILLCQYDKVYTAQTHEKVLGMNIKKATEIIKEDYGIEEDLETLINKRNMIYKDLIDQKLNAINGLFDLLKFIEEKGLKCAVATGSYSKIAKKILNKLEIEHYFSSILCSEETLKSKPDPWIYVETMKRLNVKGEECVILEDSIHGIHAALGAGSRVIAVNSMWNDKTESRVLSNVKDLTEVPHILQGLL